MTTPPRTVCIHVSIYTVTRCCCRWTGRPDGRDTRGRPAAGHQRGRPVRGAAVHGHSAAAEHGRPGGDHGVPAAAAAAPAAVLHQRRAAVHHRGRLGHRVGHHAVRAQPARADARARRAPAPVQERAAQGARVRQRLFRRHAQAVLHTRARGLRRGQHIQDSREPGQGRAAGL